MQQPVHTHTGQRHMQAGNGQNMSDACRLIKVPALRIQQRFIPQCHIGHQSGIFFRHAPLVGFPEFSSYFFQNPDKFSALFGHHHFLFRIQAKFRFSALVILFFVEIPFIQGCLKWFIFSGHFQNISPLNMTFRTVYKNPAAGINPAICQYPGICQVIKTLLLFLFFSADFSLNGKPVSFF